MKSVAKKENGFCRPCIRYQDSCGSRTAPLFSEQRGLEYAWHNGCLRTQEKNVPLIPRHCPYLARPVLVVAFYPYEYQTHDINFWQGSSLVELSHRYTGQTATLEQHNDRHAGLKSYRALSARYSCGYVVDQMPITVSWIQLSSSLSLSSINLMQFASTTSASSVCHSTPANFPYHAPW